MPIPFLVIAGGMALGALPGLMGGLMVFGLGGAAVGGIAESKMAHDQAKFQEDVERCRLLAQEVNPEVRAVLEEEVPDYADMAGTLMPLEPIIQEPLWITHAEYGLFIQLVRLHGIPHIMTAQLVRLILDRQVSRRALG